MVAFIGGFTFIAASMMAIAQNDGKKVLAFSTVSNLGLIVACAGIGVEETVWAAILLMIFHSVSKSMLFQAVGATENSIGSRDIEDMHGLILRLPQAGIYHGHRHRRHVSGPLRHAHLQMGRHLKAFVDSGNVILVIFIAYGSATTMFYWTKWLGKLIAMHQPRNPEKDLTRKSEYFSMHVLGAIMILLVPAVSGAGSADRQPDRAHAVWPNDRSALDERTDDHGHHGVQRAHRPCGHVPDLPLHAPGICADLHVRHQ